jgi:spermidine synthase
MSRASSPPYLTSVLCFFLTGLSALICEVCWIRKASLVFGSSNWAISTVLAVFFAGLAIGSYTVGKYCRRSKSPLRVYAWLELGVAGAVILSPTLFAWTDELYTAVYSNVVFSTWLLAITRVVMVGFVMLPATILMGGSLPVLCQQFVYRDGRVTRGVGALYSINTTGAVLGTLLCGFWLIPNLGVHASLYLSGTINLLVGMIAYGLSNPNEVDRVTTSEAPESPAVPSRELGTTEQSLDDRQRWLLSLIFFGVGFIAVANEVLWTRFLSLWMPNTVYTYTLTLAVVLMGIVIGSGLASLVSDHLRWRAWLLGLSQILNGLSIMLVMQLKPTWWGEWFNAVSVEQQLLVVSTAMLLPSVLSGACFPLAIGLAVKVARQSGEQTGRMAAINLVGGIAGSITAGFFLLPKMGIHYTLYALTGMAVILGMLCWWQLAGNLSRAFRFGLSLIAVFAWAAIPFYLKTDLPQAFLATEGVLEDFREGVNANVSVIRQGELLHLEINRMWQGQNVRNHQVFAAHIPALLHPDPKDVLVIGLGTGQTAGSFLKHPINRLDCLEIEDGLIQLVRKHFDGNWMDDVRVQMIVEDGRNFVTHIAQKYDIVSIEVGQIYRPRIASFYTLDFYQRLRPRLNDGGLVCQFLPIEFFGPNEFRTLVATFCEAFPNCRLWYNTSELLLIGSAEPLPSFDSQRYTSRLKANLQLKAACEYSYWAGPEYFLSRPESFVAGYLCDTDQLKKLSQEGEIYRDDRPFLEYLPMVANSAAPEVIELLKGHLSSMGGWVKHDPLEVNLAERIRLENLNEINARVLVSQAQSMQANGDLEGGFNAYRQALKMLPNYPKANLGLANFLQSQGELPGAITFYQRTLAVQPENPQALQRMSDTLVATGRFQEAEPVLQTWITLRPDSAQAAALLGTTCKALGKWDEAEKWLSQSIAASPSQPETLVSLAGILAMRKQTDLAQEAYDKAKKLRPNSEKVCIDMGWEFGQVGEHERALNCFDEALTINPQAVRAQLGKANVFQSMGQTQRAQQAYLSILTAHPSMGEAMIGLAYSLQSDKKWDEALVQLNAALRLAPDNPNILAEVARILAAHPDANKRNAQQAIQLAEKAWKLTGQRAPQAGDALAIAYASAGKYEQAVVASELAIEAAKNNTMTQMVDALQSRKALYEKREAYSLGE